MSPRQVRPLQGRIDYLARDPVALPPAIEFVPCGDILRLPSDSSLFTPQA